MIGRFSRLLSLLSLLSLPGWSAPASPLAAVSGRVLDPQGRPVADAEVWWVRGDQHVPEQAAVGGARTAADGAFALSRPDVGPCEAPYDCLVACKAPYALSWISPRERERALIFLAPAAPLAGRVVGPEGHGVAARVACRYAASVPPQPLRRDVLYLGGALLERFSVSCDAEGRYALPWLPAGVRAGLVVWADGYGRCQTTGDPGGPPLTEVALRPAGCVDLTLCCETEPQAVRGLRGRYYTAPGSGLAAVGRGGFRLDAEGHCLLTDLPAGRYTVYCSRGPGANWLTRPFTVVVRPGATTVVVRPLERSVPAEGRVLAAETAEPLVGAPVCDYTDPWFGDRTLSDANGCYRLQVLPGAATIGLGFFAPDYVSLQPPLIQTEIGGKGGRVPDLRVETGCCTEGTVVDQAGEPVAGAEVWLSLSHSGPDGFSPAVTDGAGHFAFRHALPRAGQETVVWARQGERVSALVPFAAGQPATLRLVVVPAPAVRLLGRVLDGAARPVAGAFVVARWTVGGVVRTLDLGFSLEDGAFLSEPLCAAGSYRLVAYGGGEEGHSSEREVEPGQVQDLGEVVLGATPPAE